MKSLIQITVQRDTKGKLSLVVESRLSRNEPTAQADHDLLTALIELVGKRLDVEEPQT